MTVSVPSPLCAASTPSGQQPDTDGLSVWPASARSVPDGT